MIMYHLGRGFEIQEDSQDFDGNGEHTPVSDTIKKKLKVKKIKLEKNKKKRRGRGEDCEVAERLR